MSSPNLDPQDVIQDAININNTIFVGIAGFCVLIYDHLLTLAAEIEFIWLKPKGPLVYLFLLNRYLTPFGFVVNLWAYLRPHWELEPFSCRKFVKYEGAMTLIGINVVALIMLFRIYALYYHNKYVVCFIGVVLAGEVAVNAWLVSQGEPVTHLHATHPPCTMVFPPDLTRDIASASAWFPLLYDTMVLLLTFYRTVELRSKNRIKSPLMKIVWNEGLLYYSVICSITLVLTIMIKAAPPSLQNITAQLELLLTVAMMSRITIDLKQQSSKVLLSEGSHHPHRPSGFNSPYGSTIMFRQDPVETCRSLDVVSLGPQSRAGTWTRELESMQDRVSPSGSRLAHLWSSLACRNVDEKRGEKPPEDRIEMSIGAGAGDPQPPGEC